MRTTGDGLGDCLPACPPGEITFEEREAPAYNEEAVKESKKMKEQMQHNHPAGGCPGSRFMQFDRGDEVEAPAPGFTAQPVSRLGQWPVQINARSGEGALFRRCEAADSRRLYRLRLRQPCTRISCAARSRSSAAPSWTTWIISEKLTEIIRDNDIKSVTVVRMEVPCCGGLQYAAEKALKASGKFIPWQVVTISRDGRIIDKY